MRNLFLLACLGGAILLTGCRTNPDAVIIVPQERAVMVARRAIAPVTVDGKLDEEAWKRAPVHKLQLSEDIAAEGQPLCEAGNVRLLWDDQHLYVGVRYWDSDIVAEGAQDQMHHYKHGDLAEVFLKPEGNTWYWELYVTPHGKKTHLWFPGSGRLGLESNDTYTMELHVGAQCDGTLNAWADRDSCWTGEMAIPIKELTRHGDPFGPGAAWTILVARYNYSRYLPLRGPELSMTPQLPVTSYHYHDGYASLRLEN